MYGAQTQLVKQAAKPYGWILVYVVICIILSAPVATAQIPGSADINRLPKQFERPPLPSSQPIQALPSIQKDTTTTPDDTPSIVLQSIDIEGVTVFSDQEITQLYTPYIDKTISMTTLEDITSAISFLYRTEGYILSTAVLIPPSAQDGHARIIVHERGLADVVFDGDAPYINHSILKDIRSHLLKQQPLHQKHLEAALLTINTLPGITSTPILRPDTQQPGRAYLNIKIEHHHWQGSATINNRGSHFVGPWQGTAMVSKNHVLSAVDQLSVRGLAGTDNQELRGVDLAYNIPINKHGSIISINALKTWSEPGFTLERFALENISSRLSLALNHPIIRTRSKNLNIKGQVEAYKSTGKTFGSLFTEDKIRKAMAQITYDAADSWRGVTLVQADVSQGLGILGARKSGSTNLSRANAKHDFTKAELYVARTQEITPTLQFFGAIEAQYAFDQLFSSEEFGFGGATFGRGYDPSEITGDHGVNALFELRRTIPVPTNKIVKAAQGYVSFDTGTVWVIDTNTRNRRQSASSIAIGTRFSLKPNVHVGLEFSKPLTRGVSAFSEESHKDPRVFLNINTHF